MNQEGVDWKRNTGIFLAGQGITLFGSMLVFYAVQWHITLDSQSGVAMMLLSVSSALPMFLISPFAGVWADKYNKKWLINIADALIAVITLIMALVFSFGFEYIVLLMLIMVVRGFGQGVQTPAVSSLLPEIVPEEHLIRINGFNGSMQSMIMFASPIAGGALIAFLPIQFILLLDVITAAIGISLLIFFVKTPPQKKNFESKTAWHDMAQGITYIKHHAFLKEFMILDALFNLLMAPAAVLTPLQTVRDFGEEPWRLVAIELVFFIGMMLGGALIGIWRGFRNKSNTMALMIGVSGIFIIGLGLWEHFLPYLTCMGLLGVTMSVFNALLMTVLQTKVDVDYMGRVFSVLTMISSLVMPAGMLIWGPLADVVRIDWLLLITGVGFFLIGIPFIVSKTLREAGR